MNFHIFDLSYETSNCSDSIFCQISSIYPFKKIIGKTKAVPLSKKILWNESFIYNSIFIKKVKFNIYMQSVTEGTSLICSFNYIISTSSDSNKSDEKITLENVEKKVKLTFSITKNENSFSQPKEVIESNEINDTKAIQGRYKINDFISLTVTSKKLHQIALIHVSGDKKTVQISCPRFSYLKSIIFQNDNNTTSTLIDIRKTFPTFQFFFLAIQLQKADNEKETIEITFNADSDHKQIFTKKIENVNYENLYVPIFFTFNSNSNSAFECEIESIDQLFEKTQIQKLYQKEILGSILKSKNIVVEKIYKGLLFTGNLLFREDLNILRVFLKSSTKEKIDMSFNTVSENGSLDEICFFNKPSILNRSIKISTQPYHFYVEYSMIDFTALPKKVNSIIITFTSFFGKPLSKINSIEITLADGEENIITSIPISIDNDLPGFVVGSIQKREKGWEFNYIGYSCDYKVPNLAAKAFLSTLCPADEDAVEWRDAV